MSRSEGEQWEAAYKFLVGNQRNELIVDTTFCVMVTAAMLALAFGTGQGCFWAGVVGFGYGSVHNGYELATLEGDGENYRKS